MPDKKVLLGESTVGRILRATRAVEDKPFDTVGQEIEVTTSSQKNRLFSTSYDTVTEVLTVTMSTWMFLFTGPAYVSSVYKFNKPSAKQKIVFVFCPFYDHLRSYGGTPWAFLWRAKDYTGGGTSYTDASVTDAATAEAYMPWAVDDPTSAYAILVGGFTFDVDGLVSNYGAALHPNYYAGSNQFDNREVVNGPIYTRLPVTLRYVQSSKLVTVSDVRFDSVYGLSGTSTYASLAIPVSTTNEDVYIAAVDTVAWVNTMYLGAGSIPAGRWSQKVAAISTDSIGRLTRFWIDMPFISRTYLPGRCSFSGSFQTGDGKTVQVANGMVWSIS